MNIEDSKTGEAKDIKRLLLRVYKRYQTGAINEAQATKEALLLNSVLRAIEVVDLEERIQKLEKEIKK